MDKTACDTLLTNYNFHNKIFFLILFLFSFEGKLQRKKADRENKWDWGAWCEIHHQYKVYLK